MEIPVRRGGASGSPVGYVDMDLIFREYPETKKAREEYRKEVARYKGELAEKERALDDLKGEIDALKVPPASPTNTLLSSGTVTGEPPAVSTAPLSMPPPVSEAEGLAKRQDQLVKRQEEIEKARAEATLALRNFESRQSKQILGRLYKALVQLADERGISLVVDKSAILYGTNTVDLTEALSRRVRGLPDEEK